MTYYTNRLFEKIIVNPAKQNEKLIVVSGFGSSNFLARVIKMFPEHSITLMLGMAPCGITEKDHIEFKKICQLRDNVQVLYNVETPVNHMKIYQWYCNQEPTQAFLGSSNFSEAGFFNHKEIMASIESNFHELIQNMKHNFISCLDDEVENKINIVSGEIDNIYIELKEEELIYEYNKDRFPTNKRSKENQTNFKNTFIQETRDVFLGESEEVELILKNDFSSDVRGVNEWNRKYKDKSDAHINIDSMNKKGLWNQSFFPREEEFYLRTDDGIDFLVKRTGQYGRELKIIDKDKNFYSYFAKRIGIKEGCPILYKDLEHYGRTNVLFVKEKDSMYTMDFSIK